MLNIPSREAIVVGEEKGVQNWKNAGCGEAVADADGLEREGREATQSEEAMGEETESPD